MLLLLLILFFCDISNGKHNITCGSGDGLSFVESRDGVQGRYRMEWCTLNPMMGQSGKWVVTLQYNPRQNAENCTLKKKHETRWYTHSHLIEDITMDLNCTNVCLSTNFDLIFNGTCYMFKTNLKAYLNSMETQNFGNNDFVHYMYNNNYTKESFSSSMAVVDIHISGDHVVANWFLHLIPATSYTMSLCLVSKETSQVTETDMTFNRSVKLYPVVSLELTEECTDVTRNCTASATGTELRCTLWPPPRHYTLLLQHTAPWTNGMLYDKIASFQLPSTESLYVVPAPPRAVSPSSSGALWWALGGALALTLCCGVALLVWRRHALRNLRKLVQLDWLTRTQGSEAAKPDGGGICVLLLYARDCAPLMAVAAQLRALLLHSVDHVYDLYSPEVVVAAARAPAEWVRRVLARPDVRVLLLQTPAAACLLRPALSPARHPLTLERPLLNRRVMYRAPHSSDDLLPLALRLLADAAHTAHAYKKFYVATIEGLEAELVREVTPLRRYSLPAAAALLARDVSDARPPAAPDVASPVSPPAAPPEAPLAALADAVRALHEHVRANPNYLDEELIFFDYD